MTKNYLLQWNVSEVPHCFIINKAGNAVWHGHPNNVEQALQKSFEADLDAEWEPIEKLDETPRPGEGKESVDSTKAADAAGSQS